MSQSESALLDLILDYLAALEVGATGEALARFFTPDCRQIEFPNKLNPAGSESDLQTLLARADKAKHIIRDQQFVVRNTIIQGNSAAVEVDWSGVLRHPIGSLPVGATLKAKFGVFFEFVGGRIRTQRNYDCFDS